jgi:hypothetical protein
MIYQQFNPTTDIVAGRIQTVTSGFFNDGNYSVSQPIFTTSSTQTTPFSNPITNNINTNVLNGLYYWNVYYNNQVHFSLAYGNLYGNGSPVSDFSTTNIFPTIATYQTYLNLLLDPSQTAFSFLTGSFNTSTNTSNASAATGSSIFIINFENNLYKNDVNPGQVSFSLTGNNGTFTFIDDSTIINGTSNVYNIISGAISPTTGLITPYYSSTNTIPYNSYGLFYPNDGIIILNADAINNLLGGMTGIDSNGNTIQYSSTLYNSISNPQYNFQLYQSCLYNAIVTSAQPMYVVKSELIPTTQYYVRVQNSNFNYTNNPTFVSTGNDGTGLTKGTIKIPALRNNPTTYITTVGLYDNNNELVAVAKLSQPSAKSFDNEYLIKVSLGY